MNALLKWMLEHPELVVRGAKTAHKLSVALFTPTEREVAARARRASARREARSLQRCKPVIRRPPPTPPGIFAPAPYYPYVTEEESDALEQEILKLPTMPSVTRFAYPLQSKIVEPGEHDTVYLQEIPSGKVGYINAVGNISFDDAYLIWEIDGSRIILENITWDIANINTPKDIVPWMPVENKVEWTGYNNSAERCHFQVLMDGLFVSREHIPILLGMGLPLAKRPGRV